MLIASDHEPSQYMLNPMVHFVQAAADATRLESGVFSSCVFLYGCELPNVQYIAPDTFTGCGALTYISCRSARTIDDHAFSDTPSLEHIIVGTQLEYIGTFKDSHLKRILVDVSQGELDEAYLRAVRTMCPVDVVAINL